MKKIFVAVMAIAMSAVALADDPTVKVAADSSSGTYAKALQEIVAHCDGVNVTQATGVTGGAVGNLDALVNNQAQAAFLHSDVYLSKSMADASYGRYQTLVALYPEPIHVVVLNESKSKAKGLNPFAKAAFTTLGDLRDYRVGAAGGGVYTAQILQGQGQGGFEVVSFNNGKEVLDALAAGNIDAAIFVGAAPLPNLQNVQGIHLIPVGEQIGSRVSTVYRAAKISAYKWQTTPVATLAPLANIMAKKPNSDSRKLILAQFRACFNKALPDLQDEGSPMWENVQPGDHGTLTWMELPDTNVTVRNVKSK